MLLRTVQPHFGDRLQINWRNFSLEQVNSKQGPDWHVWDAPDGYESRSLLAFRASEAARRQGPTPFAAFHFALLEARHVHKADIADRTVILSVAESANLDMERFKRDLEDPDILRGLAADHTYAVEQLGIFGTPTFVFPGNLAGYVRLMPAPTDRGEALRVFDLLRQSIGETPNLFEIKRPMPLR